MKGSTAIFMCSVFLIPTSSAPLDYRGPDRYRTSATSHITNTYALPSSYNYEEYDESLIPAGTENINKYQERSGVVRSPTVKGFVQGGAIQRSYEGTFLFGDPKLALSSAFNINKLQQQLQEFVDSTIGSPREFVNDVLTSIPLFG